VLIGFFCDAYSRFNLIVFQLAHVVEETTNPSPNELGEMDNTWDSSIVTTTNFAPKNAM
jgi:linoleoyl-CoA desaturase